VGFANTKRFTEYAARKSVRYSRVGRQREADIEKILVASGQFNTVRRHEPHSNADCDGKDFTVWRGDAQRSFGVTISSHCWHDAELKHPQVPQFWFPLNTKPETIIARVTALFDGAQTGP